VIMYAQDMTAEQSAIRGVLRFDGYCVTCSQDAGVDYEEVHAGFRDLKSAREYGISGMCQACQDSVFGVEV